MSDREAIALRVAAVMPTGEILPVGRLLSRNLGSPDRKEGFFRYDEAYLQHPAAYPLDPIHLPLRSGTFNADRGEAGVHGVFDDSLPDAWGRTILAKRAGLDRARFSSAHLLGALSGGGLGRLLFVAEDQVKAVTCAESSIELDKLGLAIEEAGLLENNLDTENQALRHLLACGSSAGGARPKVLVRDQGTLWLAKFSSIRDLSPSLLVSLEQAGMELARQAGLEVPEVRRIQIAGRDILLVKRFDVTPEGGRNAIISMRTLTGVDNPYLSSYAAMAGVIRAVSSRPDLDLAALFRWMLINVLLQNTDDHQQNFAMLHTAAGWRLSPGYDITPNIHQERHILRVNNSEGPFTSQDLLSEGRRFGLSAQKCRRLLDETLASLTNWEAVFDNCGVAWEHTRNLRESILRKRALLNQKNDPPRQ